MSIPEFLFCANKAELPNDSLILQATKPPYILGKVWQFAGAIPDAFINSTALQAKVKGYRIYIRYYGSLDAQVQPIDSLLVLDQMADYFLTHKINTNAGGYRRYKEA
jgi:hypothetical protein